MRYCASLWIKLPDVEVGVQKKMNNVAEDTINIEKRGSTPTFWTLNLVSLNHNDAQYLI